MDQNGIVESDVKMYTSSREPNNGRNFINPSGNLGINHLNSGNYGGSGAGGGGEGGGGGGGDNGGVVGVSSAVGMNDTLNQSGAMLNQSIGGGGSIGNFGYATIGAPNGKGDKDSNSISSTPSKISKFTYSEYPQVRPTNPLYTSTHTIKTAASGASRASRTSRASTMNTVSRRQKYNPNAPRRIKDWRWVSALALLLFFPTGIIAIGLAFKAKSKFNDGFIDEAKKLNKRAFALCVVSFVFASAWILTVFFLVDKWPRTNG